MDKSDQARIDDVLTFWFGAADPTAEAEPNFPLWFGASEETDQQIRDRFGDLLTSEGLEDRILRWRATPAGLLAIVIVLDQFSRNIHRGSGASWTHDPRCQRLVLAALAADLDQQVGFVQRGFLYLPLEHAEDRLLQDASVRRYAKLCSEAPARHLPMAISWLDYAIKHRALVQQFGRFPHRNDLLGRSTTHDEQQHLDEHGRGF